VPDPTLYLFDGYNLLHAGSFGGVRELKDALASFVALRGARGIVVFDGIGADESLGRLQIRYADHADALLERLAVANRERERVCLVSSDATIRGTSGQLVAKVSSAAFAAELGSAAHRERSRSQISDRIDDETRRRLERLRRLR
jgi:predicted RNA-binding protein with PIN domain